MSRKYKTSGSIKGITYAAPISPPCHSGNVYVFDIGNAQIFAGGTTRDAKVWDCDVMMPCISAYVVPPLNPITAKLFPHFAKAFNRPIIPVDSFDGQPPTLLRIEWQALVQDMLALPNPTRFLVFCQGGHGRTGTVLSVLYGMTHPDDGDPVAIIRGLYCKEAVETDSQIAYIEDMTHIKVDAKPARTFVVWQRQAWNDTDSLLGATDIEKKDPPTSQIVYPADAEFHKGTWKVSACYPDYEYRDDICAWRRRDHVSA
jgi:protein-tyrosine phosphatase